MNSLQEKLLDISRQAGEIFSTIDDDNLLGAQRLLHIRIEKPQSYVTLVGETSSGKSTLINGFYKKDVLPNMARSTTGTVTQIVNDYDKQECEYYAINKDGTIEPLKYNLFKELSMKADENLLRLQIQIPPIEKKYNGLNLFDTPGYNSLVAEHEKILHSFIPESDVIIYVVNHRVGFGMQDQILLSSIQELIPDENIPILVINRCPESETQTSKRIQEIALHASDCLHQKIEPFLVYSILQDDSENPKPIFPQAPQLWKNVFDVVCSEERIHILLNRGKNYLHKLLYDLKLNIDQQIQIAQLDNSELEQLSQTINEFSKSKQKLIDILEKYSARWKRMLPKLIVQKFDNLISSVKEKIKNKNKWLDSNACASYIAGHHISYGVRTINRDVENYLRTELDEMNKEMEDVANQAIKKLAKSSGPIPSTSFKIIISTLVAKIGVKMLGEGAKSIVIGLGGRGGIAAGTGNLVKMGFKRIGGVFGKTFSREVYTNIGKFFTKEMIKKLNENNNK